MPSALTDPEGEILDFIIPYLPSGTYPLRASSEVSIRQPAA